MFKYCVHILLGVALIACNKQKKITVNVPEKKAAAFIVRADSLTMPFLKKAVYDTAIFYNNLPLRNEQYFLNEIYPVHLRVGLKYAFNKEQLNTPIPIKEVTWEYNTEDLITVWYSGENDLWKPVDAYKYAKGAKF